VSRVPPFPLVETAVSKFSKFSLVLALVVMAGCASKSDGTMSKDMCAHCPGDQMMTKAGTCEKCGMVVDCCAACPGDQKLTSAGACPSCGAKPMVKS
jgi:hypothetical protein